MLHVENGHARANGGHLKPFSASQIEMAGGEDACQRRWAFTYRKGIREPFAKSAQAGTEVHALLEHVSDDNPIPYDLTWEGYKTGRLATLMLVVTPPLIKREFEFNVMLDGLPFTGRVDGANDELVLDFKTTSRKKYVKSARKLVSNIQRLLYVEALQPEKTLWVYGVWENFSVIPVAMDVDKKRDREKFKLNVLTVAEKCATIPEDVDPLSLEPNFKACNRFPPRGCPHKSECFPNTQTIGLGNHMSSILEKLRLEQNGVPVTVLLDPNAPPAVETVKSFENATPLLPEFAIDTLYIDCAPLTGERPVMAYTLIAKAGQEVADDAHVHHPLLIDFKGGPMLAAQLAANIKASPVSTLVVESKSAEARAVIQTLMSLSKNIIKGMF